MITRISKRVNFERRLKKGVRQVSEGVQTPRAGDRGGAVAAGAEEGEESSHDGGREEHTQGGGGGVGMGTSE